MALLILIYILMQPYKNCFFWFLLFIRSHFGSRYLSLTTLILVSWSILILTQGCLSRSALLRDVILEASGVKLGRDSHHSTAHTGDWTVFRESQCVLRRHRATAAIMCRWRDLDSSGATSCLQLAEGPQPRFRTSLGKSSASPTTSASQQPADSFWDSTRSWSFCAGCCTTRADCWSCAGCRRGSSDRCSSESAWGTCCALHQECCWQQRCLGRWSWSDPHCQPRECSWCWTTGS